MFFAPAMSSSLIGAPSAQPEIIPDDLDGAVESMATESLAVVRAGEGVRPEFLAAILGSPGYQAWMAGHARGNTIQRLSIRNLRKLRIPVTSVPVQDAVLGEILGPAHITSMTSQEQLYFLEQDAVTMLGRVLSGAAKDPIAVWVERPEVAAMVSKWEDEISDAGGTLLECAKLLLNLMLSRLDTEFPDDFDSLIDLGLSAAEESISELLNSKTVPVGAWRLVLLERARGHLGLALRELMFAEGPYVGRLSQFIRLMFNLAGREIDAMRDSVQIDIALEPTEVMVGTDSEVQLKEMFYGRARIMERIKGQLGSEANVVLLEGNRRTGKTSILKHLGKPEVLPGWIPVYCSFQDAEGDDRSGGITTRNVFRLLARDTGWGLYDAGVETWFPGLSDRDPVRPFKLAFRTALNQAFAGEHSFETFELYIEAALRAASPRRVLLMLDEFDKLQEGIDAGITSPQIPENIRHLLQHQHGLSAVITGSRRLTRLREEYWSSFYGIGHRIGVSALPTEDARRLVTEPVEGRVRYLPQARDRIVELCARHPFLIQSLCNRVFDHAATGSSRTITLGIVERAATEMVEDNEHFRTLWDYAGSARRRLLLTFCDQLADGPDPVNPDLLAMKLREKKVPYRRVTDLADDIAELRELELLDLGEGYRGHSYRLAVPLMAKWSWKHVDFDDLVLRARQEAVEAQP